MGKLKKYRIVLYEWDCVNSDMLYKEEEIIEAKDEEKAREVAWRYVDIIVKDAEEEGWEIVMETDHSVVLAKGEYEHEVGFEVYPL